MKPNIKISIVTATKNSSSFLSDCIASVGRQTYLNREHIVIDGASTDGTIQIVNQYINEIAIFLSERDSGIYDALNKGIKLATGDVIGFLHSDDFYASDDVLAKIAKVFVDPSVCAVYGDLEYVSQNNASKVIRKWKSGPFVPQDLLLGWMPAHPTLYIRRDWYLRIGGFDIDYQISADYLSVLRFFSCPDFKTEYISDVLVAMRLGGASNKSFRAVVNKFKEDWRALRSVGFGLVSAVRALVWKNLIKLKQFW